ncbi:unnamed protein product [Ceratitis capitata]|uniref:(Mediterranean fruit fly) hypothetical protein n=1 Tax=Ceratitis capitata TaxID=7213 RepID=A0A811VBF1_CERCA|nr:unnamed protein product [Ceratitis capitata]
MTEAPPGKVSAIMHVKAILRHLQRACTPTLSQPAPHQPRKTNSTTSSNRITQHVMPNAAAEVDNPTE